MINQAIHINGLEYHLLCFMQCHLNGQHIHGIFKFLAEGPSVTTYAIELPHPFNAAYLLIILLQLIGVTSYFDACSLIIAEYENEEMPKNHRSNC